MLWKNRTLVCLLLMLLQKQQVYRVIVVDIDECAPGGIASSCNETTGGVCVGRLPDRNFLCTCKPGYKLVDNGTVACEGLYYLPFSCYVTV